MSLDWFELLQREMNKKMNVEAVHGGMGKNKNTYVFI